MAYVSVSVDGGLFPSDLLDRIATGDAEGQRESDFAAGGRLSDEIQSAFSDMRSFWDAFQRRLQHSGESHTTITRESWIIPLLERLGYKDHGNTIVLWRPAPQIDGTTYAISHRAGQNEDAPPLHIVSIEQSLDRKAEGSRRSPHATVQEFLNRAPALWGVVTNGRALRVLRDTQLVSRPTYLEFDLQAMVEGDLYSEFVLLFRLLHRTRLPGDGANPDECLLETYYQQGLDEGGRVREHLRDGVEAALEELGTALLAHPRSGDLRAALGSGRLDAVGYYRQLLRLIYRLLFLMVVEERRLLFPPDAENIARQSIYTNNYSMARLRDRAERRFGDDRYTDLWDGLLQTFAIFRDDDDAGPLGLAALNGELFGPNVCGNVEGAVIENRHLLGAIYRLSTFQDGKIKRRVNYAGLDVEELGSVYESLLELHPHVDLEPAPRFTFSRGGERKQTGSYYTPPQLVRELIQSALVPVIEDRLNAAASREEKERVLLDLRVCDPASGSGHFLLAAARRIARELAKVRTGDEEPSPAAYREAMRDVIRSCIYAVDKNPLAVDLCKVALWIEGYNAGLPLSFLDNHIKHGDSLVGVFDLDVLEEGIPNEAFAPVTGDDKKLAGEFKKRNAYEKRQRSIWAPLPATAETLAPKFRELGLHEERTPYDVHRKEEDYRKLRSSEEWYDLQVACDLWTAAFFLPIRRDGSGDLDPIPTTDTLCRFLSNPGSVDARLIGKARELSAIHPFFHWPLEFPDVFARGGFDVVLGNPPWEQLQPEEVKFFAAVGRTDIAGLAGEKRKRVVEALTRTDPGLALAWEEYKRDIEVEGKFIRDAGRFDLTAVGKINTYSVFSETSRGLIGPTGRMGYIVPTGIATDDSTKFFFQSLMDRHSLASLFDFENRNAIFPGVHRSYKFCLLTLTGPERPAPAAEFAFFLHNTGELREEARRFALTAADIALLNPNTRTCPIFRTRRDAEITKAIYRRVPVLIKEGPPEENPWQVEFRQGLFNMTSDSGLFRTREDLEGEGWRLEGNVFVRGEERYLPLYEAKMLHQYDHRWATYDGTDTRDMTLAEKMDPHAVALPRYWVPEGEVRARLQGRWDRPWLLGWRDICRSTDERTVISAVLPWAGCGDTTLLMFPAAQHAPLSPCLLANLNSFACDYAARQKVGGTHLKFHVFKQLPILPPSTYDRAAPWSRHESLAEWISRCVLELAYTGWDMAPFARDMGYHGPPFPWDEERRFLLRCELDAAFFHFYGIERDDVDYILETFPIVKRENEKAYGEYRARIETLRLYDVMSIAETESQAFYDSADGWDAAGAALEDPFTYEATASSRDELSRPDQVRRTGNA